MSIRSLNTDVKLNKRNFHNPNSYNALDAGIAFIAFLVIFLCFDLFLSKLFSSLYASTGDYGLIMCLSALLSQGAILLLAFTFSKVKKVGLFSGGGYVCKVDWLNVLFGLLFVFGVYFLFSATHTQFVEDWTQAIYLTDYTTHTANLQLLLENSSPFSLFLYVYVLVPILPAICEEALYRGVVFRGLKQFGPLFAVIGSALIFAVMHGGYEQFVLQFILGIVFGSITLITKNLAINMVLHYFYNLSTSVFAVVSATLEQSYPYYQYVYDAMLIILGMIFLIVGIVYFGSKFLADYKRSITGVKKEPEYEFYGVISSDEHASSQYDIISYAEVSEEFYSKNSNLLFYDGRKFSKFNKRSNKIFSIIVLSVSVIFAVAMIFYAAL